MTFEYIKKHYIDLFCDNRLKSIFYTYSMNSTTYNNKLQIFKKTIENPFLTDMMIRDYMDVYGQIQKIYRMFTKVAILWRFKKTPIHNSENLYMLPISIHDPNVIPVFQNGQIYLFTVREVLNGMNSALSNTTHFFTNTLNYKNPYNNMIFNKSTLYNMYFAIRRSNYIMPETIHAFFLSNFNILDFRRNNEYIIQESHIKQYVSQSTDAELLPAIFDMLDTFSGRVVYIHVEFPNSLLVEIMRPYLFMYYQSTMSLDLGKRNYYRSKLVRELKLYFKNNPNFGRKRLSVETIYDYNELQQSVHIRRKKNIRQTFIGVDSSRTKYNIPEFMNSHIYDNRISDIHLVSRPQVGRVVRYGYSNLNHFIHHPTVVNNEMDFDEDDDYTDDDDDDDDNDQEDDIDQEDVIDQEDEDEDDYETDTDSR